MAQRAVEGVINAFQQGMRQVLAQKEFESNKEARDKEFEERKAEFEENKKLQKEAADRMYELQHAQLENAQAQQELSNAATFQRTGITPPNMQVIPGVKPTPDQPLVLSGLENSQLINRQGTTYNVPPLAQSPEPQLVQEQQRQLEAAKSREFAAQQNLELNRMLAFGRQQHQDTLEILGRQEEFQKGQQQNQINATRDLQNSKNSLQLQIQGLKSAGKLSGRWGMTMSTDADGNPVMTPNDPTEQINNVVEAARNGKMTLEQAKKYYKPDQFSDVRDAADAAGVRFLTDKQSEAISNIEPIAGLIKDLFDIHMLKQNNWLQLATGSGFSPAVNTYKTLSDKIGGDLAGASKFLNQVPRFTNVELGQVKNALLPSTDLMRSSSGEFTKYEKFVKEVQDHVNTALKDLPEGQKNNIRQKLGLNNLPYLGSAMQSPGSPSAIGGATPPSTQPGGQTQNNIPGNPKPGQIFVKINKSIGNFKAGQSGWVDKSEVDMQDSQGNKIFTPTKPPWIK